MQNKKDIFNNAKTVGIYGTEPYVENIYNFLKDINKDILYFIDKGSSGKFKDIDIVSIDAIKQHRQPDIFLIGSGKSNLVIKENIRKDLIQKGIDEQKIFISYNMWKYGMNEQYDSLNADFIFKNVIFEISGTCNAKCPYCAVNSSPYAKVSNKRFIKPDIFKEALDILLDKKLIDKTSIVHLFNWGEPFMHPNMNEILNVLCEKGISYGLSTNASIAPNIKKEYICNLDKIKISMPGFSQQSYDKIHGFKFEKILGNINKLINIINDNNKIEVFFYVYQFNLKEMDSAKEYFGNKGIQITHRIAFFNDYNKFISYANCSMDISELTKVSKELLLYYVDDFIDMNKNYKCFYMNNTIVIDENLDYATCCILPQSHPNYKIGSVKSLSKKEIIKRKKSQPICEECFKAGITYWMNNVLEYNDFVINGIFLR